MLKKFIITITTIITISCGNGVYNDLDRDMVVKKIYLINGSIPDTHIDEELKEFYYEFLNETDLRGVYVDYDLLSELKIIRYGKTEYGVAGVCMRFESTKYPIAGTTLYSQIIISEEVKNYSYMQRKGIMFHELGHCLLNKGHTDTDGDIMSVNVQTNEIYEFLWDYLLDDFFDGM